MGVTPPPFPPPPRRRRQPPPRRSRDDHAWLILHLKAHGSRDCPTCRKARCAASVAVFGNEVITK